MRRTLLRAGASPWRPRPTRRAFWKHPARALSFPPRFGEHNAEIYGGLLGVTPSEIKDWKARGII